jgi:hypothetical protein
MVEYWGSTNGGIWISHNSYWALVTDSHTIISCDAHDAYPEKYPALTDEKFIHQAFVVTSPQPQGLDGYCTQLPYLGIYQPGMDLFRNNRLYLHDKIETAESVTYTYEMPAPLSYRRYVLTYDKVGNLLKLDYIKGSLTYNYTFSDYKRISPDLVVPGRIEYQFTSAFCEGNKPGGKLYTWIDMHDVYTADLLETCPLDAKLFRVDFPPNGTQIHDTRYDVDYPYVNYSIPFEQVSKQKAK